MSAFCDFVIYQLINHNKAALLILYICLFNTAICCFKKSKTEYFLKTNNIYLSNRILENFTWKIYEIKTSCVRPKVPKARPNIICKLYMIYQYRTGSNPADINRFRRHTGKLILLH